MVPALYHLSVWGQTAERQEERGRQTDTQTGGTRPRERTVHLEETERSHSGGRRGTQGVQAWASSCCALVAGVMKGQSPTFLGHFFISEVEGIIAKRRESSPRLMTSVTHLHVC